MHNTYPDNDVSVHMRLYLRNNATGVTLPSNGKTQVGEPAAGHTISWQPRLRCNDCQGKWYNVRKGHVTEDFSVHLTRNQTHKDAVARRLARK
jgi:hypothetical protein